MSPGMYYKLLKRSERLRQRDRQIGIHEKYMLQSHIAVPSSIIHEKALQLQQKYFVPGLVIQIREKETDWVILKNMFMGNGLFYQGFHRLTAIFVRYMSCNISLHDESSKSL